MKPDINWFAAIVVYLLFIAGLITYATYDLTNLATIKDWPLLVTVVDLIWGSILTASVSVITYFIAVKV
jgi:uncharacterized membrane protein